MDISIRLEMIEESLRKLLIVAGGTKTEKWFRVEEVSEILGLGETKVRELMSSGRLRSVHVDSARRVPEKALREFQDEAERSERSA